MKMLLKGWVKFQLCRKGWTQEMQTRYSIPRGYTISTHPPLLIFIGEIPGCWPGSRQSSRGQRCDTRKWMPMQYVLSDADGDIWDKDAAMLPHWESPCSILGKPMVLAVERVIVTSIYLLAITKLRHWIFWNGLTIPSNYALKHKLPARELEEFYGLQHGIFRSLTSQPPLPQCKKYLVQRILIVCTLQDKTDCLKEGTVVCAPHKAQHKIICNASHVFFPFQPHLNPHPQAHPAVSNQPIVDKCCHFKGKCVLVSFSKFTVLI